MISTGTARRGEVLGVPKGCRGNGARMSMAGGSRFWKARAKWMLADSLPLVAVVLVVILLGVFGGSQPVTLRDMAALALVSGLTACSVVEAAKRILRLRGYYQERQVRLWLEDRAPDQKTGQAGLRELIDAAGIRRSPTETGDEATTELPSDGQAHLGDAVMRSQRDRLELFDLPMEQLAGQIGEAVELMLKQPTSLPSLAHIMTGRPARDLADSDPLRERRATQQARAALDNLQITIGRRWRRYVAGNALWLSGLVGFGLMEFSSAVRDSRLAGAVALFAGGFLSWVIRDLAVAVERARR